MLSEEAIAKYAIPQEDKIEGLIEVLHKLDEATIAFGYAIYSSEPRPGYSDWVEGADIIFWSSEGMQEIKAASEALEKARRLTQHAIYVLDDISPVEVMY